MAFLTILEQRREARARPGPRGHESRASPRDLRGDVTRACPRVDGLMFAQRSHGPSADLTTPMSRVLANELISCLSAVRGTASQRRRAASAPPPAASIPTRTNRFSLGAAATCAVACHVSDAPAALCSSAGASDQRSQTKPPCASADSRTPGSRPSSPSARMKGDARGSTLDRRVYRGLRSRHADEGGSRFDSRAAWVRLRRFRGGGLSCAHVCWQGDVERLKAPR
jgi:hypothetical protein